MGCGHQEGGPIAILKAQGRAPISSRDPDPPTCRRMAVKLLERLIGKLWYMHLVVLGAIGHFYALQVALTSARAANRPTKYL